MAAGTWDQFLAAQAGAGGMATPQARNDAKRVAEWVRKSAPAPAPRRKMGPRQRACFA